MGQVNCTTCVKTVNKEELRNDKGNKEKMEDRINEMQILRGIIKIQALVRG